MVQIILSENIETSKTFISLSNQLTGRYATGGSESEIYC
jgi:hypothetical protein